MRETCKITKGILKRHKSTRNQVTGCKLTTGLPCNYFTWVRVGQGICLNDTAEPAFRIIFSEIYS